MAEPLAPYVELALTRLSALYDGLTVSRASCGISLSHADEEVLEAASSELLHLAYQEKIYEDGREVRRALYARLLGA